MRTKIKNLSVRLLLIPFTVFFVLQLFSQFAGSLNALSYELTKNRDFQIYLKFDALNLLVLWFTFVWLFSLFVLEICAAFQSNFKFRRLLTNLRYAPFFILLFSALSVIAADQVRIEHSKWKIRNYVYGNSNRIEKPDFSPHVDYRGWCGNGYSARLSELYFDVAAEGLSDDDPAIRARAFLMTLEVRDFFNGGDRTKLNEVLRKVCRDKASAVRNTANEYLESTDCEKYLSPE